MIRYELSKFWQKIYDYKYIEEKQMIEDLHITYPKTCSECNIPWYKTNCYKICFVLNWLTALIIMLIWSLEDNGMITI
jgi:hypothetical protein